MRGACGRNVDGGCIIVARGDSRASEGTNVGPLWKEINYSKTKLE